MATWLPRRSRRTTPPPLKTLREIATGVIRLQAAGVEAAAGAAGVLSVAPERVFTADALKGF